MLNLKIKKLLEQIGCTWEFGKLLDKKRRELCNFLPEVKGYFVNSVENKFVCQIQLHIGDHIQHEIIIRDFDGRKMDYTRICHKCIYGVEVSLNEINRILQYIVQKQIMMFSDDNLLLTHLGWNQLPDGKMIYCAGKDLIGCHGDYKIMIDEKIQKQFNIEETESKDDVLAVCAKLLKMECPTITILILVCVVACLRNLFVKAGAVPHFVVYLYGTTGTYKTTIAKYFSRLYGDKIHLGGLFGELESTNFALEESISQARDVCMVVDDIAPCQKDRNTKEKKERVASLIRKATSEVGTRKGAGGQVVDKNYDVVLIFTAEELLETVSTMNRTVILNTDQYKLKFKNLKIMQKTPDFSVLFQKKLIEWAANDTERTIHMIEKHFYKYRDNVKLTSEAKSLNRIHESFSILHVAWDLLKSCGKYYENEEFSEADAIVSKTVRQVVRDETKLIKKIELHKNPLNPLGILYQIINTKEVPMAGSKMEFRNLCDTNQEGEVFGVWHKGYLYLKDEEILGYMQSKYNLKVNKREFRNCLEREALLIKDKSKNKRKKLDGKSFAVIDFEGLKDLCE